MSKRFDWTLLGQMELGLDVEQVELEGEAAPSYEEIQARSEMARQIFEKVIQGEEGQPWEGDPPGWFDHYLKLRELQFKFNWRVACFIAWASSPKASRWPKTQEQLAIKVLGLSSARQISEWRKKYVQIDDAITMMQAAPLWEHRADIYDALVAVASDPDYKAHPDRKLAMEMMGDYVPRSKVGADLGGMADDLSQMSDAELDNLSRRLGVDYGQLIGIGRSGDDQDEKYQGEAIIHDADE